jgi:hypothetical protein
MKLFSIPYVYLMFQKEVVGHSLCLLKVFPHQVLNHHLLEMLSVYNLLRNLPKIQFHEQILV